MVLSRAREFPGDEPRTIARAPGVAVDWGRGERVGCRVVRSEVTRWCKMNPRRLSIRRRWVPRLISLAVLLGVCAAVVPIPIAVPVIGQKDRSEPFPCQDHACGCLSAAQCWNHCCCMTDSAKLAWSRRHGVRPPEFVIAAAEREAAQRGDVATSRESGACCGRNAETGASCSSKGCSSKGPSALKSKWAIGKTGHRERTDKSRVASCAEKRSGEPLKSAQRKSRSSKPTSKTFLLTALVQKCQGHSNYWHSLPWSVIAPRFELPQRVMPIEACCTVENVRVPHVAQQPPAPPPRGDMSWAA